MDVEARPQPNPVEATPSGGRDSWFAKMTHVNIDDLKRLVEARSSSGRFVYEILRRPLTWMSKNEILFIGPERILKLAREESATSVDDINAIIKLEIENLDDTRRALLEKQEKLLRGLIYANIAVHLGVGALYITGGIITSLAVPYFVALGNGVITFQNVLNLRASNISRRLRGSSSRQSVPPVQPSEEVPIQQPQVSEEAAQPTPVPLEPVSEVVPPEEEVQAEVTPARESRIRQAVRYVLNIHLGQRLAGWVGRGWERLTRFFRGGRREQRAEITTRERGEGFGVSLLTYKKHIGDDLSDEERLSFNEYALGIPAEPEHIFGNTGGSLYGRLCNLGIAIYGAKRGYLEGRGYDFPHIEEVMRSCIHEMVISEGFDIATYSQDFQRILATSGYMQEQRMSLPEVVYVNMVGNVLRAWLGDTLYEDFKAGRLLPGAEAQVQAESVATPAQGGLVSIDMYKDPEGEPPDSLTEMRAFQIYAGGGENGIDMENFILLYLQLHAQLYGVSDALFSMKRAYVANESYDYDQVRNSLAEFIQALVSHADFNLDICSDAFIEILAGSGYSIREHNFRYEEEYSDVADDILLAWLGTDLQTELVAGRPRETAEAEAERPSRRFPGHGLIAGIGRTLTRLLRRLTRQREVLETEAPPAVGEGFGVDVSDYTELINIRIRINTLRREIKAISIGSLFSDHNLGKTEELSDKEGRERQSFDILCQRERESLFRFLGRRASEMYNGNVVDMDFHNAVNDLQRAMVNFKVSLAAEDHQDIDPNYENLVKAVIEVIQRLLANRQYEDLNEDLTDIVEQTLYLQIENRDVALQRMVRGVIDLWLGDEGIAIINQVLFSSGK